MGRTYIPKLLRMAGEMRMYLVEHQHHMVGAAHLTSEQAQVLQDLLKALNALDGHIGRPLFPEMYRPKARPARDTWFRPTFHELYQKQGGRCYYCGAELYPRRTTKAEKRASKPGVGLQPAEFDHAQPRSRNGKDEPGNYRLACMHCNRDKGVLPEAEFQAVIAFRKASTISRLGE